MDLAAKIDDEMNKQIATDTRNIEFQNLQQNTIQTQPNMTTETFLVLTTNGISPIAQSRIPNQTTVHVQTPTVQNNNNTQTLNQNYTSLQNNSVIGSSLPTYDETNSATTMHTTRSESSLLIPLRDLMYNPLTNSVSLQPGSQNQTVSQIHNSEPPTSDLLMERNTSQQYVQPMFQKSPLQGLGQAPTAPEQMFPQLSYTEISNQNQQQQLQQQLQLQQLQQQQQLQKQKLEQEQQQQLQKLRQQHQLQQQQQLRLQQQQVQVGSTVNANEQNLVDAPSDFGRTPQRAYCQNCKQTTKTYIRLEDNIQTHISALILHLMGCYCCWCVPYWCDLLKSSCHYCSTCNNFLGSCSKRH